MESVVLSRDKNFLPHQFVFEAELHSQPRDAHMVVQVIWIGGLGFFKCFVAFLSGLHIHEEI